MKVRAIIFDLEGTLFYSPRLGKVHMSRILELISRKLAISKRGASRLLELKKKILTIKLNYTPPLTTLIETFGISRLEFYNAIGKVDPKIYLKPDIKLQKTLEGLKKKGLKLALLTNVDHKYALRILKALNIHTFFDCIVAGNDVIRLKPNIEPFYRVLKELNVEPQQVLMVGDRIEIDLKPAHLLRMKGSSLT